MNKLDMESKDIVEENIEKISKLFPNVIVESESGKSIDFDLLKQELSKELIEGNKEKYQLTWPGKKDAIINVNTSINKTLRLIKEKSINYEDTHNIYIEGDNLDVLKILQESYLNKIKCIYIDPPYNTGNDFIYNDKFVNNSELEESGQIDEYNNRLITNAEHNGKFHSDWLTMMYPRLRLARNLLTEDGLIIINIDENEIVNLQYMCNEIFGENNDLGTMIWDKRNPKGDSKGISCQHEYILVYAKNKTEFLLNCKMQRKKKNADMMIKKAQQIFRKSEKGISLEEINNEFNSWLSSQKDISGGEKAYNKIDNNGKIYQAVSMSWPNNKKAPDEYFIPLIHPITNKECPVPEKGWRNPPKTMQELLSKDLIIFGEDETTQPRRKYLLEENLYENIPSLIYYGGSDKELLSELTIPFDTPKVVNICKEHIDSFTNDGDIILDFFSGSATIAHAVMQLNAENAGKRKYILVQIPEYINKNSEISKTDFKTICDIGEERIRKAGKKIKKETNAEIDYGFRVYKVDSSNMKDVYYKPRELKQSQLGMFESNIKEDRNAEDLLIQVILDLGLTLDLKIEEKTVLDNKIYFVDENSLIVCFDNEIDISIVDEICKYNPLKVVFKDESFKLDNDKINLQERFKKLSPNTEICIL